jgi:hypothetical protein
VIPELLQGPSHGFLKRVKKVFCICTNAFSDRAREISRERSWPHDLERGVPWIASALRRPDRSGNLYGAGRGRSAGRRSTDPGAMLPGWFFDACSSISCFPDFPNPFSTTIRMPGILWRKRRKLEPLK